MKINRVAIIILLSKLLNGKDIEQRLINHSFITTLLNLIYRIGPNFSMENADGIILCLQFILP